ncbi:MAG: hypothetical protein AB1646_21060 [Thermodesulfobacteriota bacterium]
MTKRLGTILLAAGLLALPSGAAATGGITPEEIFQSTIDWRVIPGTWEVLPQDNPLAEPKAKNLAAEPRAIMTLRQDGTCRVINKTYRAGSDGLWTHDGHRMFVKFPDGSRVDYFVYGIRGDFMITRSPHPGGRDELWARVK